MDINIVKKKMDEDGFIILEELISPQECQHFKSLLESDFERYSPFYPSSKNKTAHSLENKSNEKVVFNLQNKNLEYYKLFSHPEVIKVLDATLKPGSYKDSEPYHLMNTSARCPLPGAKGQQLHLDSNLSGCKVPIIVNVLWMLDDFTKENGATRVLKGSHLLNSYAEDGKTYPDEICAEAPKGSALIFNASLWHGGSDKITEGDRWAVILGYARWWVKPIFDFMRNMPLEIYNQLSDEQKDLLGYKSVPPLDEFTRQRRRSEFFEVPSDYKLPT